MLVQSMTTKLLNILDNLLLKMLNMEKKERRKRNSTKLLIFLMIIVVGYLFSYQIFHSEKNFVESNRSLENSRVKVSSNVS